MATVGYDLDQIRGEFPSWVVFRSDEGVFYATRLGERLSFAQIKAGFQQTVCADDAAAFVGSLRDQDARR